MLVCKGAPDVLLKRCSHINDPSGGPAVPLSEETIARLTRVQESWAAKGQRVLLLAKRSISSSTMASAPSIEDNEFSDYASAHLNIGLTVVGLVGLVDPPRPDIPETVRIMRGAGIRFFMVTGDFALTAVAIAEQCGMMIRPARSSSLVQILWK
jgi:sodium/potassium-transporting ATPase subunit alpha